MRNMVGSKGERVTCHPSMVGHEELAISIDTAGIWVDLEANGQRVHELESKLAYLEATLGGDSYSGHGDLVTPSLLDKHE